MDNPFVIVTCEHGGNDIPPEFLRLFRNLGELLNSHRGYDPGALELARMLADSLEAQFHFSTVSRLLIDLNRSLHSKTLFSEITVGLPPHKQKEIVERYYTPYRREAEAEIRRKIESGLPVLHVSVHTFTPVLRGEVRKCDVGLLYDPARHSENALCAEWQRLLKARLSGFRIRRNYPYHGAADGFTTYLRTRFTADSYAGIELEINQRFFTGTSLENSDIAPALIETFRHILQSRLSLR